MKHVRKDHLDDLPVPNRIKTYLNTPFYYSEQVEEEVENDTFTGAHPVDMQGDAEEGEEEDQVILGPMVDASPGAIPRTAALTESIENNHDGNSHRHEEEEESSLAERQSEESSNSANWTVQEIGGGGSSSPPSST